MYKMRALLIACILVIIIVSISCRSDEEQKEFDIKMPSTFSSEDMQFILNACTNEHFPPSVRQCDQSECVAVMPPVKAELCKYRGVLDPYTVALSACSEKCWNQCMISNKDDPSTNTQKRIDGRETTLCVRDCIFKCLEGGSRKANDMHSELLMKSGSLQRDHASFIQRDSKQGNYKGKMRANHVQREHHQRELRNNDDKTNVANVHKDVMDFAVFEDNNRLQESSAEVKNSAGGSANANTDPWWLNPPPWWMPPPPEWGKMPATAYNNFYAPSPQQQQPIMMAGPGLNINGFNNVYSPSVGE